MHTKRASDLKKQDSIVNIFNAGGNSDLYDMRGVVQTGPKEWRSDAR